LAGHAIQSVASPTAVWYGTQHSRIIPAEGGKAKVSEDNRSSEYGMWERILRSRLARGIIRVHVGLALARSWALDTQIPPGTSIHLFDYLLYRKTDRHEPFDRWVETRELLSP